MKKLKKHQIRRSFSTSFGKVQISVSPSSELSTRFALLDKLPCGVGKATCHPNHQMEKILSESVLKVSLSLLKIYKVLVDSYNQKIKEKHNKAQETVFQKYKHPPTIYEKSS
jgi:hypothetical protein